MRYTNLSSNLTTLLSSNLGTETIEGEVHLMEMEMEREREREREGVKRDDK